jgi:hypothetical protein
MDREQVVVRKVALALLVMQVHLPTTELTASESGASRQGGRVMVKVQDSDPAVFPPVPEHHVIGGHQVKCLADS